MANHSIQELWKEKYGRKTSAVDYAGREMRITDLSHPKSEFEPTIDHIRPLSQGGTDNLENMIICNRLTNAEKKDIFPTWKANEKFFQAKRIRGKKGVYEIIGVE